ncbi:MAG TPA: hypothetical protein DCZ94_10030 [Lentisphaeria bacterium]|nr:MAG: hypothetical protein A2X48_08440 [Lentisphaerae bacterium GWF2_49_21]HBC87282.1 hypothetical protein [Lentisphaeria bacterium]
MLKTIMAFLILLQCACLSAQAKITDKGQQLSKFLDGLQVDKKWLASVEKIDWQTGEFSTKTDPPKDPRDPAAKNGNTPAIDKKLRTHSSSFVAAACEKLGIYILKPAGQPSCLLSNAQYDWLLSAGAEKGWTQLLLPNEAQDLANQGNIVVAVWKNLDPEKPGHIVIVRPCEKNDSQITNEGPDIIQAGTRNYNSTTLKEGFKTYKGAFDNSEILFFSHPPATAAEKK